MNKQQLQALVAQTEQQWGIPPGVLDRLVQLESSYNPNAYHPKSGASGLTQIIKRYHPAVSNPFDPYEALAYTGQTLRRYFDEFGHWQSAVAAWHSGEPAVRKALAQGKLVPDTVDSYTGLPTSSYAARIVGDAGSIGIPAGAADSFTDLFAGEWNWQKWATIGAIGLVVIVLLKD